MHMLLLYVQIVFMYSRDLYRIDIGPASNYTGRFFLFILYKNETNKLRKHFPNRELPFFSPFCPDIMREKLFAHICVIVFCSIQMLLRVVKNVLRTD